MLSSIKFRALTDEERKLFFEALGEYGKDFQNIQQYMAQKGSQKSSSNNGGANSNIGSGNNHPSTNQAISNSSNNNNSGCRSSELNKTLDPQEKRELDKKEDDRKREQIRGFYNKVYAKLSELVGKIDDRVEKVNQELYLLINYGEIWKRHGFSENFSKPKRLLEELVYHGTATYKFEKRNVRLRTPTCKALKKINKIGVDEEVKVVTTRELPKEVTVELHPASNRDWLKVQSISQNPRVKARLSIQKRLTTILDYLENKWNISPEKLNRNVDVWLKVSSGGHQSNECTSGPANTNHQINLALANNNNNYHSEQIEVQQTTPINYDRLRLKPSNHHELKEVNITRVVPDNHLDLSLSAYIKRLEIAQPKFEQNSKEHSKREQDLSDIHRDNYTDQLELYQTSENIESSTITNKSRLPVSLTTPDCSILLERSCTSDQPSIAQARKHLNILQSLTGTLEGCENSRTAYEDTQDRSLMNMMLINQNSRSTVSRGPVEQNLNEHEQHARPTMNQSTAMNNKDIPALYDEDAALPVSSSAPRLTSHTETSSFGITTSSSNNNQISVNHMNSDSQNSKSVDFQIPKNVTLGDFFKMSEPMTNSDNGGAVMGPAGDEANDAFPLNSVVDKMDEDCDHKDLDRESEEHFSGLPTKDNNGTSNGQQVKLQNHMIEIKKFAEGWTRQDEPSVTLGELYLAFKCPEKIVLEYEFESAEFNQLPQAESLSNEEILVSQNRQPPNTTTYPTDDPPNNSNLIYKLLTAASLSLAQIERRKQEQQHKLHEAQQSCSKMKRRKGSGQGQAMTLHDIEATNQRVEEALKQLQPIRLSSFKRTR